VELAIEAYRAALKELPEDPDVANNLAYLLTTRPAGCEEAAKLATTAVGLAEKYRISGSRKKIILGHAGLRATLSPSLQGSRGCVQDGLGDRP
jgi:hypothetical protein